MNAPKRGDLVYLTFDPQAGHEQRGRRPGIVLSPQPFNNKTGFALCCPITNQQKGYPFEVSLPVNRKISGVILTDQIKSLDWKARKISLVVEAPNSVVQSCLELVKTYLD